VSLHFQNCHRGPTAPLAFSFFLTALLDATSSVSDNQPFIDSQEKQHGPPEGQEQ
jgi:hypothetical protein